MIPIPRWVAWALLGSSAICALAWHDGARTHAEVKDDRDRNLATFYRWMGRLGGFGAVILFALAIVVAIFGTSS